MDLRAIDQAGENIHDDDEDMGSPIFSSTPVATNHISVTQLPSSSKKGEHFVKNLYDSVKVSDVFIDEGTSMAVTEVGTIEELPDLLIGSETNENSGPAYDLQMFRRLLTAHQVPQLLPFLCLDAPEMRMQSHADCSPVMLMRFLPTEATASILRSLMAALHFLPQLQKCSIHVAVMGSGFDERAYGQQRRLTEKSDVQFHILHPTLSSTRMVVANILTGKENTFLTKLNESQEEACQAADAVKEHREMLQQDPELRKQQEEEYFRSEEEDRRKESRNKEKANMDEREGESSKEDTVIDTEEMRKKRLAAFDQQRQADKRWRDDNEDDGDEDSGTVTFRI